MIRTLRLAHGQAAQRAGSAEARSQSLLLGNSQAACHTGQSNKRERRKKSLFTLFLSLSQKKEKSVHTGRAAYKIRYS